MSLLILRNPVTALLSIVFVLALFSLPAINYFSHRDELLYGIQERELPLTADNIYSALQNDFIRPKMIADLMANDPLLINWLNSGEADTTSIFSMLQQRLRESRATITFLASEKSRRYYNHNSSTEQLNDNDPNDEWYFAFLRSEKTIESNIGPDHKNPQQSIIYINIKIFDAQNQLLGVTGIGFENNYLKAILANYQQRFSARVFLVNKQQRIAFSQNYIGQHGRELGSLPGYEIIKQQAFDQNNHFFKIEYDNAQFAVQTRYIPELNGYLFVERNIDRLLQGARETLIKNLLICTLITLVSLPLILMTLGRYQRHLEIAASTDALTGLLNRHAFVPIVEQSVNEAQRNQQALCILLIDVDHFKKINDTYGHLFGDATLRQLAQTLSASLRKSDAICRWGGEEFIILLKETDTMTAHTLAEKIRATIATTPISYDSKTITITASIGIASYRHDENYNDWFERCDKALYKAKDLGRNRCELAAT